MPLHRRRGYTGREGGEEEEKARIRAVKMARKEAENESAENLAWVKERRKSGNFAYPIWRQYRRFFA
jgi:hypothetical protein